ncbi:MAG: hypothetical protein JWM45_4372, partial [Pseudonocardiales bacterium]|nr:hypothetical protein [Pseudonocardiales bacterium]
ATTELYKRRKKHPIESGTRTHHNLEFFDNEIRNAISVRRDEPKQGPRPEVDHEGRKASLPDRTAAATYHKTSVGECSDDQCLFRHSITARSTTRRRLKWVTT